jgi:hypothetical protein
MWKVTFNGRFGTTLIYWVARLSASDAETTARQQAAPRSPTMPAR